MVQAGLEQLPVWHSFFIEHSLCGGINFSADSASGNGLCFSRRFQSLTGQETICFGNASRAATSTDLETWKQDLLAEVRREIQTVKLEIIEGKLLLLYQV